VHKHLESNLCYCAATLAHKTCRNVKKIQFEAIGFWGKEDVLWTHQRYQWSQFTQACSPPHCTCRVFKLSVRVCYTALQLCVCECVCAHAVATGHKLAGHVSSAHTKANRQRSDSQHTCQMAHSSVFPGLTDFQPSISCRNTVFQISRCIHNGLKTEQSSDCN